jgi:hypothetical protein
MMPPQALLVQRRHRGVSGGGKFFYRVHWFDSLRATIAQDFP